jgi:hypothetical protein
MRQFKFRAWNKAKSQMVTVRDNRYIQLYEDGSGSVMFAAAEDIVLCKIGSNEGVLMQFTGLKDKNGKDIYEGDLITHVRSDRPWSKKRKFKNVICLVKWNDGVGGKVESGAKNPSFFNQRPEFVGEPLNYDLPESGWVFDWSEFHDCEIIGNKFENPELLQQ